MHRKFKRRQTDHISSESKRKHRTTVIVLREATEFDEYQERPL